jgi:hypothetical protein
VADDFLQHNQEVMAIQTDDIMRETKQLMKVQQEMLISQVEIKKSLIFLIQAMDKRHRKSVRKSDTYQPPKRDNISTDLDDLKDN